jgi:hypothetical protein
MDKRILELALETLEKRKAAIDAEIQSATTRIAGGLMKGPQRGPSGNVRG